jgi:4-alpha-glucanotransferase
MSRRLVVTFFGSCFLIMATDTTLQHSRCDTQCDQRTYLRHYHYPNAKLLKDLLKDSTRGDTLPQPLNCVIYTSSDDFQTVCKWYKEKCDFSSKEVFHAHVAHGSAASLLEDSSEQQGRRPLSILALCDYNAFERRLVMVVISRGDKEAVTHIMLTISRLPA